LVKKIVKIDPADHEIIGLQEIIKIKNKLKNQLINESETYSPFGKYVEQTK